MSSWITGTRSNLRQAARSRIDLEAPMKILTVYGTTEGHTRNLCHFVADRLREAGHLVTLEEASLDEAYPDPAPFDAVVLAASLHIGRYQPTLTRFARAHHEAL